MLMNRSGQYALQALIYLSRQPPGKRVMVREMADSLNLPMHYLAKLMHPLSRAGWLDAQRGKHGGYRLLDSALDITLLDILREIHRPGADEECLLGLKSCGDDDACVLHCQWRPVRNELVARFGDQTLRQLAQAPDRTPA